MMGGRDAARTRLATVIGVHTGLGDGADEIARAVDELIAVHGDVAGWWRGYRDTVRAYQGAGAPDLPPPVVGENVGARTAEALGAHESGPTLYVRERVKLGAWHAWTNIADAINADDGECGPVRHYVSFGEVRRARQEGHDDALQAEPNEQARMVVAHHNEVVALQRDLADAHAKLAHDVEEIDAVKRERDAIVDGLAKRLEYVAASRRTNALVSPDMATAAMHREVAGALTYEARRLRDPQTGDGEPAPRSPPSTRGLDDPCAKGHDWASTRLSDGREWQWCKRCQKCPEYVLEAMRRILGAREGESVSDAAERVVKDLAEAIEHRRALIDEVGVLRRAHVSEPVRKIVALEDALSARTTERDEARSAMLTITAQTREALDAHATEATPDAAARVVTTLRVRTVERDDARRQRDETQRELKDLRSRVHGLLARLPGGAT